MAKKSAVPDMRGYVSVRVYTGVRKKSGKAKDAQIRRTHDAVKVAEEAATEACPELRYA